MTKPSEPPVAGSGGVLTVDALSEAAANPALPVTIVRWPEEGDSLGRLRAAGTPRILLVAPEAAAPDGTDCAEDWIRLPATDDDVRARALAVAARASRHDSRPEVKGDGRITVRDRWVALSQTEEAMARVLVEGFGDVVDGDALAGGLGDASLSDNAVRVQMMRLRKRIRPLGLVVRTVRGRGYVLEQE